MVRLLILVLVSRYRVFSRLSHTLTIVNLSPYLREYQRILPRIVPLLISLFAAMAVESLRAFSGSIFRGPTLKNIYLNGKRWAALQQHS